MLLHEHIAWKTHKDTRVLLHEAEKCGFCGETYISLYPLSFCLDHEGLEKI